MADRAIVLPYMRLRTAWIPAIVFLMLPLAPAHGQRLVPAAVTSVGQTHDSLPGPSSGERQAVTSRGRQHRVLKGVAVGAPAGAASGVMLWWMRTVAEAVACDLHNGVGSDTEYQRCNWHAYRRRAQYTWTGLVLGGVVGGIGGRLTRGSHAASQP